MPHDSEDMFEADNATRAGRGPVDHPTMLHGCARAATTAELRYRVPYPNSRPRTSRIFALDAGAAEAMYAHRRGAVDGRAFPDACRQGAGRTPDQAAKDLPLSHPDGTAAELEAELQGADVVVLLASQGGSEGAAEVIARECFHRGIMCAGLALARGGSVDKVVNSMRRFARVLVVAQDEDYIPAMLTALRA